MRLYPHYFFLTKSTKTALDIISLWQIDFCKLFYFFPHGLRIFDKHVDCNHFSPHFGMFARNTYLKHNKKDNTQTCVATQQGFARLCDALGAQRHTCRIGSPALQASASAAAISARPSSAPTNGANHVQHTSNICWTCFLLSFFWV